MVDVRFMVASVYLEPYKVTEIVLFVDCGQPMNLALGLAWEVVHMRNGTVSRILEGFCLLILVVSSFAQTVQLYVSSKAGDRLATKKGGSFQEAAPRDEVSFTVNDSVKYQKIDGFGASLLESGLMVLNTLPPDQQEAVLKALFDPKDGSGFSAMKTELAGT